MRKKENPSSCGARVSPEAGSYVNCPADYGPSLDPLPIFVQRIPRHGRVAPIGNLNRHTKGCVEGNQTRCKWRDPSRTSSGDIEARYMTFIYQVTVSPCQAGLSCAGLASLDTRISSLLKHKNLRSGHARRPATYAVGNHSRGSEHS